MVTFLARADYHQISLMEKTFYYVSLLLISLNATTVPAATAVK